MQFSVRYIFLFSATLCLACALGVSSLAVSLRDRQEVNKALDKKRNVLEAAGLKTADEKLTPEEIEARFAPIVARVIDLRTGGDAPDIDPVTYDQRKARQDPARSEVAPDNNANISRVPHYAQVYEVRDDSGALEMIILPIEGYGLWSTLYGFLALEADLNTVKGITYYEHLETPGLGGEVDNPRWKGLWPGRKVFDGSGDVRLEVIRGAAGPVAEAPYEVDGLSGATITARGVSNMIHFWLGDAGFAPFLERLRSGGGAASSDRLGAIDRPGDDDPVRSAA